MSENILIPIDPLNISFSIDKCLSTPETLAEHPTVHCPKTLIKDPRQLFAEENVIDRRRNSERKTFTPSSRYNEVFQSPMKTMRIDFNPYVRSYSKCKSGKQVTRGIGKVGTGEHLMELKKLDSLIKRINSRIEVSRRLCP